MDCKQGARKIQVAFHVPILPLGGAQRIMVYLANGLVERGFGVTVVLSKMEGELISELNDEIKVIAACDSYKMASFADYKPVAKCLKELAPDICIANMSRANFFCGRMKEQGHLTAPLIMWVHSSVSMEANVPIWKPVHWLISLYKKYSRQANVIVTVSDDSKKDFCNRIPSYCGKVQTVYNPVLPEGFVSLMNQSPSHLWLTHKLKPTIVTCGRLAAEKGHLFLLEAFAKVRGSLDSRLIIFGEGPLRTELEQRVLSLGLRDSVSLPGAISNVYAEVHNSDLFVLTSKFEGLSGALIEALACETPVVSLQIPFGGTDEILLGGKYGTLVPPGDSVAFAGAMVAQLLHPKPPPPEAKERFLHKTALDNWVKLIEGLVQAHSSEKVTS